MSNAKQAAFENLQRLAVLLKDIISVGPELAKIGSIENAQAEAQAQLDSIRTQMRAERENHDSALASERVNHEAALTKARRDAETEAAVTRDAAQQHLDAAQSTATGLIADAKVKGEALFDKARTAAREHEARFNLATQSLQSTQQRHVAAQKELARIEADLAERRAEHERVQGVIADAKARLG